MKDPRQIPLNRVKFCEGLGAIAYRFTPDGERGIVAQQSTAIGRSARAWAKRRERFPRPVAGDPRRYPGAHAAG
jgi:hypothetical protein